VCEWRKREGGERGGESASARERESERERERERERGTGTVACGDCRQEDNPFVLSVLF
jgi:hypothetical protein